MGSPPSGGSSTANVDPRTSGPKDPKLKDVKQNLVTQGFAGNEALPLAREMKKQGPNPPRILPNAYTQEPIAKIPAVAEGGYVFPLFSPFESKAKPAGLK